MAASEQKAQPAPNATTQIVTGAGRLLRVIVQATGTGVIDIYDNTATAGTPVFSTPASPAVGTVYELQIPLANGLRIVAALSAPQVTVVYNGG